MKQTIFRLTYAGLLIAAILACGAVASFAQDPCTDVAGQNAMQDEFDKLYANKTDVEVRKQAINSGKAFLDKYGSCPSTDERSTWLKKNIPLMEQKVAAADELKNRSAVVNPFNAALQATNTADATAKAKAYADAYSTGQAVMAKYPNDYRTVEIVLATIGGDEALIRNNNKYADDTLRYAKMAIADLEANKSFAIAGQGQDLFGLSMADPNTKKVVYDYSFKDRNAALGWMNLYVGNILYNNKNDHAGALPYLYKATKLVPDSPAAYAMIGNYYFDQLKPLVDDINTLIAKQKAENNVDNLKAMADEYKTKVAMLNGVCERTMDAYARAYTISTKADYKASMKTTIDQVFKVRYGEKAPVTMDAWIASAVTKPFADPTTPVQPIADPEPVKTTTGEAAPAATPATPAKTTGATAAKKPGAKN
jgi:tetratricopeptide (TPR) repeat protein